MTPWVAGPVIPCPFVLCSAQVELVIEQARPDNDEETVQRIPIHDIAGLTGYRGACPASLMGWPLEGAAQELLDDEAQRIQRIVADRPPVGIGGTSAPEHSKTPHPNAEASDWFGKGTNAGGRPRRNDGPAAEGYARLPLGMQGPNIHTPPAPHVAPEASLTGGDMSDNMREQFRALTNLAIEGFGQAQEICATLTEALDAALALAGQLGDKHDSTITIASAAVGGANSEMPISAANMVGSAHAAGSTIDDVKASISLALTRVEAVHASYAAAAESGQTYLGVI